MIQQNFYESKTLEELAELEKTTTERLETIRYVIILKEGQL